MFIIKIGGSEGIDYDAVCADVATLVQSGKKIVLIHGGSNLTNHVATALGHPPEFITSPSGYTSRLTDQRTLEIFTMVYCGQMNKSIVQKLQALGVNAIGLSGIDGGLWRGKRKQAIRAIDADGRKRIIRNNYTGRVEVVNTDLLTSLLDSGFIPVLTPPAISYEGEAINVDGDRAAAATAIALQADQLLILSNIPGVLTEFPDENSLLEKVEPKEIAEIADRFAQGRMRIKLLGAQEAIAGGVGKVVLGDARIQQPIQQALNNRGTVIQATQSAAVA